MRQHVIASALVVALVFGFAQNRAHALQATDPSGLINSLVQEAIANITDQKAADTDRETKFRNLLQAGFDIPRISRFVLGRYWSAASEQERQKFASLFEDWIVQSYSARFKQYSGEAIRVTGTRSESDVTTVVLSQFTSPNGAPPAKVEWHVRKGGDGTFKVVDVSVEGVSMALAQRDEVAAVADRNGGTADSINKALESRLATASASAN